MATRLIDKLKVATSVDATGATFTGLDTSTSSSSTRALQNKAVYDAIKAASTFLVTGAPGGIPSSLDANADDAIPHTALDDATGELYAWDPTGASWSIVNTPNALSGAANPSTAPSTIDSNADDTVAAIYIETTTSGLFVWNPVTTLWVSTGFTNPLTTRGDILVRNASNNDARLALGNVGQALVSDGSDVIWKTPLGAMLSGAVAPVTSPNTINSDADDSLAYGYVDTTNDAFYYWDPVSTSWHGLNVYTLQGATDPGASFPATIDTAANNARPAIYLNTTSKASFLWDPVGTAWISLGLNNPMTTRGDLLYRNSSNVNARLPVGTAGQVLTSDGTDTLWDDLGVARAHADDTSVAPATAGAPTAAEIDVFATANSLTDRIVFYTGDDVPTNPVTYVFHADKAGAVTLLNSPSTGVTANGRSFADNTAVAPAVGGLPTPAEIQNFTTANTLTDRVIYYTGNDTPSDTPTHVFWVDGAGVVTMIDQTFNPLANVTTLATGDDIIGLNAAGTAGFKISKTNLVTDVGDTYSTRQTLTDAPTIAYDAALGVKAKVTLTSNRTLGALTNASDGMGGILTVIQDATGNRTLTLDSSYTVVDGVVEAIGDQAAGKRSWIAWDYDSDAGKTYCWVTHENA